MSLKKQLKSLFFPVWKEEAEIKGYKFSPALTHLIIADTPTGPLVVNSCSKNYGLISNEELMMPLIERLEGKYHVEAKVTQFGYAKFYTDFIIKDIEMQAQKKDPIFPRIRMNNSYDGSVKYQFGFGFYREVCTNGLMAPVKGAQSKLIKLRHTPTNSGGAVAQTMGAIDLFLDQAPDILKGYDPMIKHKLSWDAAAKLMEDIFENTKYPKKKGEEILARLKIEQEMGLPISQWLLYNSFNHVLYNDQSQMKIHKKDKLDSQVLHYISNS